MGVPKGNVGAIRREKRGHCTELGGTTSQGRAPKVVPDADCVTGVGKPAGCEKVSVRPLVATEICTASVFIIWSAPS